MQHLIVSVTIISCRNAIDMLLNAQIAVKKRSRRHMLDTDEILANSTEGTLVDVVGISTGYQKMKTLCYNTVKEINTDIELHNHHILPR